jgi:RNA polymerase sigma factor (sigma-70 family)
MSASMATQPSPNQSLLAEPGLRRVLEDFVRRRVPASDVDDVVQTVLCDALASAARPADSEELKKWLLGIARHKVADHHRRAQREPAAELPEIEAHPPPIEERALARWAEEQAASTGEAQKTLAWMAREGEGEKLESIAAEENVPAARVRQRVSRMRRWMKERWMAELAAVALLSILAVVAWRFLRRPGEMPEAKPEKLQPLPPIAPPIAPEVPLEIERARSLRAEAVKRCDREEWQGCLDALDEAARLDPAGDTAKDVAEMRGRATRGLEPPVIPTGKIDEKLSPPSPKSEIDGKNVAPQPTSVPPPVTKPAPKPTTPFDGSKPPSKAAPSPKKSPGKSVFDSDFK